MLLLLVLMFYDSKVRASKQGGVLVLCVAKKQKTMHMTGIHINTFSLSSHLLSPFSSSGSFLD